MVKKRRWHTSDFKFRVTLEAFEDSKTVRQLSSEHEVHANLIRAWKRQLLEDGQKSTHRTALCSLICPDRSRPDAPYFPHFVV